MNKKHFILAAALLAGTALSAESTFDIGLKAGYRQTTDKFSQNFTTAAGADLSGWSTAAAAMVPIAPAVPPAPTTTLITDQFNVNNAEAKDKFVTLTIPMNFNYDNWKFGLEVAYGFGGKTKVADGETDSAAALLTTWGLTGTNSNKKAQLFEVVAGLGYGFQITDSFTLTPRLGWECTSIKRKTDGGLKITAVPGAAASTEFIMNEFQIPKYSKTTMSSPFAELEAKFKPSDEVSLALAVGYSMPQIHTGYSVDVAQLLATHSVVMKETYKKRANKFNIRVNLDWALNDALSLDVYGKASFLNAKSNKTVTPQTTAFVAAVAAAAGVPAVNQVNSSNDQGTMAGKRKFNSWEAGLGLTYKF